MDHADAHPQAGERVLLALKHEDPTGVLFDKMIVTVTDWQDRVTGVTWKAVPDPHPHPLHADFRRRTRQWEVTDRDLIAVEVDERTGYRLVHHDEIGRTLPGS